jgi:hypothetical protein
MYPLLLFWIWVTLVMLFMSGEKKSLDAFIQPEECPSIYIVAMPWMLTVFLQDQESWMGSMGHIEGDSNVYGLSEDGDKATLCRQAHLHCNGILVCQFFNPNPLSKYGMF